APTPQQVRRALARAERGAALDVAEAEALLAATGADLDRMCAAAAQVRDAGLLAAGRPGVVTYSPKVFIPVTRLCRDRCHYCTFVETPGQAAREGRAPYLSPDEILDIARQGAVATMLAARNLGIPAIDFSGAGSATAAFKTACHQSARTGFTGKLTGNPDHIGIIKHAFGAA
ncbi:MAG: hypothetical protein ABGW90_02665, partial [Martelella sp.]